ncbi:MAG TPA: Cu(I)-responsive transcriptional regulator [Alphaproteobacteria bacterium]
MNIGEAEKQSGLPAKTIRYYEEVGLVRPARGANRYRSYSDHDLHKLRFLQRARGLGFSVGDCRTLLSLYEDRRRSSADVKAIGERHLARIDAKIAELASLRAALAGLVEACRGDHRPDCPILDDLAGATGDGEP